MNANRISYLYKHYQHNKLTAKELDELKGLINTHEFENQFKFIFDINWKQLENEKLKGMSELTEQKQFDYIVSQSRKQKLTIRFWPLIAIAASVGAIIFAASLLYFSTKYTKIEQRNAYLNDIKPGKQGGTLTLMNGQKILINDALAGKIADQSGVIISKTKDGQIVYELTDNNSKILEYNTLSTPPGEQTQVRLPDGSLVFLNAASSLKYPTSFAKQKTRRVSLEGEGYFEISKDKTHPFVVTTDEQEVEVLGTHFNINAYHDEPLVRTTLLEGSVNVFSLVGTKQVQKLKPNQQSILSKESIKVEDVDGELFIAWKNGMFIFNDEPLHSIMRRIARWYNVKVSYEGVDKNELYGGSISRSDNVSKVLSKLELTGGIHFKIEGREIIVMK